MRVLGTFLLLSFLRASIGQRPFQGPAQVEADRRDFTEAGTDAADAGAIMLVGQSLATYKAQRLKLRWNDQDPCGAPSCNQTCSWRGLICSNWRITGLVLDGALLLQEAEQAGGNLDASTLLLSGTLSEAVSRLDALEILALPNHRIQGMLPVTLGRLNQLKVLDLSGNCLAGTLPMNWAGMRSLTFLNLASNRLEGYIPSEWLFLISLSQLNISGNSQLCDCPVLQHVLTFAAGTAKGCPPQPGLAGAAGLAPPPSSPPGDTGGSLQQGLQANISMSASVAAAVLVLLVIVLGMWHKRKQDALQQMMLRMAGDDIRFFRPEWMRAAGGGGNVAYPGMPQQAGLEPPLSPPVVVLSPDGKEVSYAIRLPGPPHAQLHAPHLKEGAWQLSKGGMPASPADPCPDQQAGLAPSYPTPHCRCHSEPALQPAPPVEAAHVAAAWARPSHEAPPPAMASGAAWVAAHNSHEHRGHSSVEASAQQHAHQGLGCQAPQCVSRPCGDGRALGRNLAQTGGSSPRGLAGQDSGTGGALDADEVSRCLGARDGVSSTMEGPTSSGTLEDGCSTCPDLAGVHGETVPQSGRFSSALVASGSGAHGTQDVGPKLSKDGKRCRENFMAGGESSGIEPGTCGSGALHEPSTRATAAMSPSCSQPPAVQEAGNRVKRNRKSGVEKMEGVRGDGHEKMAPGPTDSLAAVRRSRTGTAESQGSSSTGPAGDQSEPRRGTFEGTAAAVSAMLTEDEPRRGHGSRGPRRSRGREFETSPLRSFLAGPGLAWPHRLREPSHVPQPSGDWQRREAWEGGQWSDRMPMYVAHLTETAEGVLELVACPVDSAASPRSQSPAQRDSSSS